MSSVSHRDSFKHLSFRRTQEENSWIAAAHLKPSASDKKGRLSHKWEEKDKMKEEEEGKKGNCRNSTPCQKCRILFLSDLTMCINVGCMFTFMMSWLFVRGGKRQGSTQNTVGVNHRQSVAYCSFHCKIFTCCINFHFWRTSSPQNAANTFSGSVN